MEKIVTNNLSGKWESSWLDTDNKLAEKLAESEIVNLEARGTPISSHRRSNGDIASSLIVAEQSAEVIPLDGVTTEQSYVCSRETKELLSALSNRKSTPANLLRPLLDLTCTKHPAIHEIYLRERSMDMKMQAIGLNAREYKRVKSRLQNRQIAALRIALREEAGNVELSNHALYDIYSQMDAQLGQLQVIFGCQPEQNTPTMKEFAEAHAGLDRFSRMLDRLCVVKKGVLDAESATQLTEKALGEKLEKEQYKSSPHHNYPHICEAFLIDLARHGNVVLEHADGSKEMVAPPRDLENLCEQMGTESLLNPTRESDKVAKKLEEFCGDKSLLVTQLCHQRVMMQMDINRYKDYIALPFKNQLLTSYNLPCVFTIKANDDGTFDIKYSMRLVLRAAVGDNHSITIMNMNLSHWNIDAGVTVSKDGEISWNGLSYDAALVPIMSAALQKIQQKDQEFLKYDYLESCPGFMEAADAEMRERAGLAGKMTTFDADLLDTTKAQNIALDFAKITPEPNVPNKASLAYTEIQKLHNSGGLDWKQTEALLKHEQFVRDAFAEIKNMEMTDAATLEATIAKAAQLAGDLRLVQQNLISKKAELAGKQPNDACAMATIAVGMSDACELALNEVGALAADFNAALDDFRGGIGKMAAGSRLSRVEMGYMQCAAMHLALSQMQQNLQGDNDSQDASTKIGQLLAQVVGREQLLRSNLAACHARTAQPLSVGPGAEAAVLQKGAYQTYLALAQKGPLPSTHPQFSQAQLIWLEFEFLARQNPVIHSQRDSFLQAYSAAFGKLLSSGSWAPITSAFYDVGAGGKLRQVTSTITPAPSFEENEFANNYHNRGVPSNARMQGAHVCNLAHTCIANEHGLMMFAGLRHGVLDAYDVTKEKIGQAPPEVKNSLVAHTAAQGEQAGNAQDAASLRKKANANMAQELMCAAVVGNPLLLRRAREGKSVTVNMDSISLSSPEVMRPFSGKERRMLNNQMRALDSLKSTMEIKIADSEGQPKTVSVTVNPVRKFNFAVGESSLSGKIMRMLGKFLSWRRADRMNLEPLQDMLGPLGDAELGGEAEKVLKFLGNDPSHGLDEQQQEVLQTMGGMPSAFQDPQKRAQAIRVLGAQIKQISAQRTHHGSGQEPYQLASRVALLGNLLGRTTTFNCKSGKDRTSQLDEAVKCLAADVEAERFPLPGAGLELQRRTNYALRTGNLELQQYNTGLRGHLLQGKNDPRSQLSSKLSKKLFYGDSRHAIK